jgi:hypothetical protein
MLAITYKPMKIKVAKWGTPKKKYLKKKTDPCSPHLKGGSIS